MTCRTVLLGVLLSSFAVAQGQKEDHIWYFGHDGLGLDHRGCEPVVVLDGSPDNNMWEGAATIADATTGALLFYTSGYRAYNSMRVPMPNGNPVGLSNSLAQMVIVPWPGTASKYFLFIPEVQGGISWQPQHPAAFSLYYAVIDMALDGGSGDVESKFNVLFTSPHCEFLTAVPHLNGTDLWLIGHEFNSSRFFSYSITGAGISSAPVLQDIGPFIETPQPGVPNGSNLDAVGAMRASPDGTRLAFTTAFNGFTCVFDFDRNTGTISDPMLLTIPNGGMGLSFSPDGSKLYVAVRTSLIGNTFQDGTLVQFDLASGIQTVVQSSSTIIHQCVGAGGFATLKLGPNGRLYVARVGMDGTGDGDPFLGVVNAPDQPGAACNYVHDGIWLEGARGTWGLSNSREYGHECKPNAIHDHDKGCDDVQVSSQGSRMTITWGLCDVPFQRVVIRAVDGRILLEERIPVGRTEHKLTIPNTSSGVYLITLDGSSRRVVRRTFLTE